MRGIVNTRPEFNHRTLAWLMERLVNEAELCAVALTQPGSSLGEISSFISAEKIVIDYASHGEVIRSTNWGAQNRAQRFANAMNQIALAAWDDYQDLYDWCDQVKAWAYPVALWIVNGDMEN
jgi:hypothetical protein